uniref:Uncharacterized protein n=1 Tax=Phlebotomus papatasi TaxID=29031 RepID=A0A1B0GQ42_PHLPP
PKDVGSKTSKSPSNVPDYLLDKRPQFVCVGQILKDLTEELKITKIQSKIPVRNINIPSYWIEIKMTDGRKVTFWLDLLDKEATMADSKTPTAILRLKMRLVRNMEQDFVLVNVVNKEGEELKEILRKAIKEHLESLDSESEDEIQGVIK